MDKIYNYDTGRLETKDDRTPQEMAELVENGKAVKVDLSPYDKFRATADELHAQWQAKEQRLKESDNPLHDNDAYLRYELDNAEKEYREQSAQVEAEYSAWRNEQLKQSKVKAAQSVVKVSDKDKEHAQQFANRALLDITMNNDKGHTIRALTNDIHLLTDGQRVALQGHVTKLLDVEGIDTADRNALINATKAVKNSDVLAYEIAKQLPMSVLTKQRITDAARSVRR